MFLFLFHSSIYLGIIMSDNPTHDLAKSHNSSPSTTSKPSSAQQNKPLSPVPSESSKDRLSGFSNQPGDSPNNPSRRHYYHDGYNRYSNNNNSSRHNNNYYNNGYNSYNGNGYKQNSYVSIENFYIFVYKTWASVCHHYCPLKKIK